jgi:6-phosphogluconolactonase
MTWRFSVWRRGCELGLVLLLASALQAQQRAADAPKDAASGHLWVYVGTYTGKDSKGIYRFDFDLASGKLSNRELAGETVNPSFLAIHPNRRFLYAVNEIADFGGKQAGAVTAFALDPQSGKLARLNQQSSGGAAPCHLVVDKAGKHVLAANYGGGSAVVLPILADGRLGEATDFVQHKGTGTNPQRQEGPHAHSINLDSPNRHAVVADLGLDKVLIYRFDEAKGKLSPNDPPFVALPPGSGPRHFAFHPNGRNAYVINELASTVTAFDYNADRGVLKPVQTVSTLPPGSNPSNSTAEVQVHPSGRFLYGSNRGFNTIAVFAIDPQTGELRPVGQQGHRIKTPRNFGIDPTGQYLIVANQDGNSLVVFRIDPGTGELKPTGAVADVPTPVCVKMMPRGARE